MTQDLLSDKEVMTDDIRGRGKFDGPPASTDAGRFAYNSQQDREENDPQIRVRRSLVDNRHFEGLRMTWVNDAAVNVGTGSFGADDNFYEVTSPITVTLPSGITDQFAYIFLAVSDDDPGIIRGFFSKDTNGKGGPKGFTTTQIVGSVSVDSSSDIRAFSQCGEFWRKSYSLVESFTPSSTSLTASFQLFSDVIPDSACEGFFSMVVFFSGSSTRAVSFFATPEVPNAGTPVTGTSTRIFFLNPIDDATISFHMGIATQNIFAAVAPTPSAVGEFHIRGWTDEYR